MDNTTGTPQQQQSSAELPQGLIINERYQIGPRISSGGVGVLYQAQDLKQQQVVALKVIHDDAWKDQWISTKFLQEMEALSRIDHPGVISLLDQGKLEDGRPYLVMPFVNGETLKDQIKPEGLEIDIAVEYIRQTGKALEAAHEKGIFHRDLKPENIMIETTDDGMRLVKLIDFGLAKVQNSRVAKSTSMPNVAGTYAYMSPEQLTARKISAASDVYSFAVVCHEMLTGRKPYNPETPFELLEMQKATPPLEPGTLRPALKGAPEAVLMKAMSFSPADRFGSVSEFSQALISSLNNAEPGTIPTRGREAKFGWEALSPLLAVLLMAHPFYLSFFRFEGAKRFLMSIHWISILLFAVLLCFLWNFAKLSVRAALIVLLAAAGVAFWSSTRTTDVIEIKNRPGAARQSDEFTLNYSDHRGYRYEVLDETHTEVTIDPGRWNRIKDYELTLMVSPELEFADVFLDKKFALKDQLELLPSHANDILKISKKNDGFQEPRRIKMTYKFRNRAKSHKLTVSLKTKAGLILEEYHFETP